MWAQWLQLDLQARSTAILWSSHPWWFGFTRADLGKWRPKCFGWVGTLTCKLGLSKHQTMKIRSYASQHLIPFFFRLSNVKIPYPYKPPTYVALAIIMSRKTLIKLELRRYAYFTLYMTKSHHVIWMQCSPPHSFPINELSNYY